MSDPISLLAPETIEHLTGLAAAVWVLLRRLQTHRDHQEKQQAAHQTALQAILREQRVQRQEQARQGTELHRLSIWAQQHEAHDATRFRRVKRRLDQMQTSEAA